MTRAQFLAIAVAVGALGAGAALTYNYQAGVVDMTIISPGHWDQLNAASCTSPGPCNSTPCVQAKSVLTDAGSPCVPILVDCDWRITPLMLSCLADAGIATGPQLYQRLELIDLRCPAVDGGFAFGGPFDSNGCPAFPAAAVTPGCVRAPLDGGQLCLRDLHDGDGGKWFGTGNVFPLSQRAGSNCDAVVCGVFYGDDPETSL